MLYGTAWKADRTAKLVHQALRSGFRGVDTAAQPKHYRGTVPMSRYMPTHTGITTAILITSQNILSAEVSGKPFHLASSDARISTSRQNIPPYPDRIPRISPTTRKQASRIKSMPQSLRPSTTSVPRKMSTTTNPTSIASSSTVPSLLCHPPSRPGRQ